MKAMIETLSRLRTIPMTVIKAVTRIRTGFLSRYPITKRKHGRATNPSSSTRYQAPIGVAKLEAPLCLLYDDRECDICAKACPFEAIEIVWNQEEYIALPQVEADKCPGCGACEVICPGTNDWERENADDPIPLRKAIAVHA